MASNNGLLSHGNAESIFYSIEEKFKKKLLELKETNTNPVVTRLKNISFTNGRHITYLCITFENKQSLSLPVCNAENIGFYESHVYIYVTADMVIIEMFNKREKPITMWSIQVK